MKRLSITEKVLQFLITKNYSSIESLVAITRADINTLELTVEEVIHALKILNVDNYIRIIRKGGEDFCTYWQLELTSTGIHYFEAKQETKKEKRNKWIQFWIPVGVSIAALGVAVLSFLCD